MASYSSILNKEKNNNRSDPSRMNNIDHTQLARLRPDKFDDMAVKQQISLIQQACGDVDPETIAIVFHECDYNVQQAIARIQAGDFAGSEWQTAKSTNKKKNHPNHNLTDQLINGNTLSDSERSLSQRTSPTSSFQYSSSTRTNPKRRGNDLTRPSNTRYASRMNSTNKSYSSTGKNSKPSEISSPSKQSNENVITQITSSEKDDDQFEGDITQSLTFDNSEKKMSTKHRSIIPQQPVSMHPTIQFSNEPIDIQFGDVQWNDSIPRAVSPSESEIISTGLDHDEQEISSTNDQEQNKEVQDTSSSNYINHQTTNEIDNQLFEVGNQLSSSLSITDHTLSNNLPIIPPENTSHLSDQLNNTSSPVSTQYSSQQQTLIPIPITRLPPTSTPRAPEYTSPTSQFIPNNLQQNNGANTSAFTPFNTLANYPTIPRDYQQPNWNPQTSNYKTNSKPNMIPPGTYQQQQQQQQPSYQLPPQQQQILLGTYPYPTLSPAVVQVFAPIEQWQTGGYSAPLDSYLYATNYIPTYANQQQYHPQTKYDIHPYDKEFFNHYGQTRSSNNDVSYQQQQQQQPSTPSQSNKDNHVASKLSPTAAAFSQGAPLTVSPPGTAFYINPLAFPIQNYLPSIGESTTHQDRTLSYSSMDNRDNRNGASYGNTNNRNNYYHPVQQQQRTHNTNASNSSWHMQQ